MNHASPPTDSATKPLAEAAQTSEMSLRRVFLGFMWRTKKFWLAPLVLALILLALLYYMAGKSDVVAPFIYDL